MYLTLFSSQVCNRLIWASKLPDTIGNHWKWPHLSQHKLMHFDFNITIWITATFSPFKLCGKNLKLARFLQGCLSTGYYCACLSYFNTSWCDATPPPLRPNWKHATKVNTYCFLQKHLATKMTNITIVRYRCMHSCVGKHFSPDKACWNKWHLLQFNARVPHNSNHMKTCCFWCWILVCVCGFLICPPDATTFPFQSMQQNLAP